MEIFRNFNNNNCATVSPFFALFQKKKIQIRFDE